MKKKCKFGSSERQLCPNNNDSNFVANFKQIMYIEDVFLLKKPRRGLRDVTDILNGGMELLTNDDDNR